MGGTTESTSLGREMALSVAALFGAASIVTALVLLLPHAPQIDAGGLVVIVAYTGVIACALARWGDRLPQWAYPPLALIGTATVSLALFFDGERHGGPVASDEMFYLWVVLWAAYYFKRLMLATQIVAILAAYGATLALMHTASDAITRWTALAGLAIGAAVVVRMLRERSDQLVSALRLAALADPLTGLPNRRALELAFAREGLRQRRDGLPFSLLLVDLDRFKQLNDEHGHKAGDRALTEVAALLRHHARPVDTAARIGGDEFALLLSKTDKAEAARVRARLWRAVQQHAVVAEWPSGASIGLASSDEDGASMDALMRHADMRLYAAKRAAHARLAARSLREAG
jgi:diguanylate cyclase (GGDEF)-like protein